jgi:hypothetical protein
MPLMKRDNTALSMEKKSDLSEGLGAMLVDADLMRPPAFKRTKIISG